jgi:hypothetical protein
LIAGDAHGTAAAHFRADQDGILQEFASPIAIHEREAGANGRDHCGRQHAIERGRECASLV